MKQYFRQRKYLCEALKKSHLFINSFLLNEKRVKLHNNNQTETQLNLSVVYKIVGKNLITVIISLWTTPII
jgi:hypothetical protein